MEITRGKKPSEPGFNGPEVQAGEKSHKRTQTGGEKMKKFKKSGGGRVRKSVLAESPKRIEVKGRRAAKIREPSTWRRWGYSY